jgi:hypothetical protein
MMMAWRSSTFTAPANASHNGSAKKIDNAADKHRAAMTKVVKAARTLAKDSQKTLNAIKDPQLKQSASR